MLALYGRADQTPLIHSLRGGSMRHTGLAQPRAGRSRQIRPGPTRTTRSWGPNMAQGSGSSENACDSTQVDEGEWPAKPPLEQPGRRDGLTAIPGAIEKAGHEALLMRLAATAPTTAPISAAESACRPNTIKRRRRLTLGRTPPRSEDAEIKASPRRAARK